MESRKRDGVMRDPTTEPADFVNAEGVKWWHEPSMTIYVMSKGLVGVRAWTVERPDGYRTRVLTKGEAILAEDQTIEGMGVKLNLLVLGVQTSR